MSARPCSISRVNVPAGFELTLANPNTNGTIYYTTNGTHSALVMAPARYAPCAPVYIYAIPLALNRSVIVNARVFSGSWSALSAGNFTVGSLGVPLRITELMYDPIGGANYEFLEVQNIGPDAAGRGRLQFRWHHFCLSRRERCWAAASEGLVLANNRQPPTLWAARYPGVAVAGWYGGNLNNAGERIALFDTSGRTVFLF